MCQITVADWVEPVGKPPFGTSDPSHCGLGCSHKKKKETNKIHGHAQANQYTRTLLRFGVPSVGAAAWVLLKGTKLWPNSFLKSFFLVCFGLFFLPGAWEERSPGFSPCCHWTLNTIQLSLLIFLNVSFHTVCMSRECVSVRALHYRRMFVQWTSFYFFCSYTDSLLKHTLNTRQFKRMAYRKKIKSIYKYMCIWNDKIL